MRSYPFEAVLFDLDGVVIDSTPLHREVWTVFLRSHGCAPSAEELRQVDGRRAADVIANLLPGPLAADELKRLTAEREGLYQQHLTAGPLDPVLGIESFLAVLRAGGVRTALATSATAGNAALALRRVGLENVFDACITAADVSAGKPDPEVYLKAAGSVGVPPARCLVAEDAIPGVQAAKAAGACCLGITTSVEGQELLRAGADYLAADFLSMPDDLRP